MCELKNKPFYLKLVDADNNTFYFVYSGNNGIVATNEKDVNVYIFNYVLDTYMTKTINHINILKQANPEVYFIKKFNDRVLTLNSSSIALDFYEQKAFGNYLMDSNPQFQREILYSTNAAKIWANNFTSVYDQTFTFTNLANTSQTITYTSIDTLNDLNCFKYLNAKNSAIKFSSYVVDQTQLIIPFIVSEEENIYKGLQNIDITSSVNSPIDALATGELKGLNILDLPFSVLCEDIRQQALVNPTKFGLYYLTNKISSTSYNIPFIKMPVGYAPEFMILNFTEYNGLESKIKNILNNYTQFNEDTEPSFLNPNIYKEGLYYTTNHFIETDMSFIRYVMSGTSLDSDGIRLYGNFIFENDITVTFNYKNYNNEKNIN
jgi:hypothetical protein